MTTPNQQTFYGWHLLSVLWVIYFSIVGFCFYGAPVLFPLMIQELGWDRTDISIGFMTAIWVMGFGSPAVAWAIRRFGARKTISLGGVLAALGCFCMQFATSIPLFSLFFGVFVGLGIVLSASIPVPSVVTVWFQKYRGRALGIVLSAGAIGGFIAPPILTYIVKISGGDWRAGWLSLSVIAFTSACIAALFIRNKPSDLKQHPDGIAPENVNKDIQQTSKIYRSDINWTLKQAIKTPQFWVLAVTLIASYSTWQILITQGPLHLADRGFTPAQYSLIYGAVIGLSVIGRLGAGFLADFIEPKHLFIVALSCSLIGCILFWFVSPERPITLAFPLFSGIGLGMTIIAKPNMISNYWGVESFAGIYSSMYPLITIFNGLAVPFAGIIYDKQGSYLTVILVCCAMLSIALIIMFFISYPLIKIDNNIQAEHNS